MYWQECVIEALNKAEIVATDEQVRIMAEHVELSSDNYERYSSNPYRDECVSHFNKSKKTVPTLTEHEVLLGKITSLTHRVGDMEFPLKQLCDNAGIDYQYDGTDHIPYGAIRCAEAITYEGED